MIIEHLPLAHILVGTRQRPLDESKVRDIARSIEQQGLLQPIGVKPLPEEETYLLVFGAHRLAAVTVLDHDAIAAYVLPDDWTEAECLLAELQENSARNDLTGVQRKAYAAEIGRLIANMTDDGMFANGKGAWIDALAQKTGNPLRTMYNWWNAFCADTGLAVAPSKALDVHKHQFYDWLDAQQRHAEEEKARKAQEAWAQKRAQDLEEARAYLHSLIDDYDEETVWEGSIVPVFPHRCL